MFSVVVGDAYGTGGRSYLSIQFMQIPSWPVYVDAPPTRGIRVACCGSGTEDGGGAGGRINSRRRLFVIDLSTRLPVYF